MTENLYGDAGRDPGDSAASVSRFRSVKRRANGHVVLDSTWARRLGVRRSGGMYRITRRELMERLQRLQQTPMQRVPSQLAVQSGRGLTTNEPPLDDIVDHGHPHFVGFYETEGFLVDSVRDFLAPALRTGGAAIVVATDAHRDSFDRAGSTQECYSRVTEPDE